MSRLSFLLILSESKGTHAIVYDAKGDPLNQHRLGYQTNMHRIGMATIWFLSLPWVSLRLLAGYIGIMFLLIFFAFEDPSISSHLIYGAVIITGAYLVIAPIVYFLEKSLDKAIDKIVE